MPASPLGKLAPVTCGFGMEQGIHDAARRNLAAIPRPTLKVLDGASEHGGTLVGEPSETRPKARYRRSAAATSSLQHLMVRHSQQSPPDATGSLSQVEHAIHQDQVFRFHAVVDRVGKTPRQQTVITQ